MYFDRRVHEHEKLFDFCPTLKPSKDNKFSDDFGGNRV